MDLALLGTIAMWTGAVAGAVGAAASRRDRHHRLVDLSTRVALGAAVTAVAALAWGMVAVDTSLETVVRSTSRATPWPYRLSGVWASNEGSLLLYGTLLLGWGAAGTRGRHAARGVVAGFGAALLALAATAASPFSRLPLPTVDGDGLLAILQHPAMVIHPPVLYSGLTMLVVPFALLVCGAGPSDHRVRRSSIAAWVLLVVGMALGSSWAYAELGWGGLWAWDPIENTSLVPWLVVTAYLHGRSAGLAALAFPLTLLGGGLTRSGITGSVHAFADGGWVALAFPVLALLSLAAMRRVPAGTDADPWRRLAVLLTSLAAVAIAVGSTWPALSEHVLDRPLAVDSSYFVTTTAPIAVVALVSMVVAFSPGTWPAIRTRIVLALAAGGAAWLAAPTDGTPVVARVVFASSVATAVAMASDLVARRRPAPAVLAHLGLAVLLVGFSAVAMGTEFRGAMEPGDTIALGGDELGLRAITTGAGERWISVIATFDLVRDGRTVAVLEPEIRAYEDQDLPVPEPVVRQGPAADLVVAVSRVTGDASLVFVNAFRRPLVWLVWVGSALLVLAGLLDGRSGAGATRHRPATAGRQPRGATTAARRGDFPPRDPSGRTPPGL